MGDRPDYEAERPSYWRSIENRRKAGIAAAVAMAVLGVAGSLALSATHSLVGDEQAAETSGTIIPAEETTDGVVSLPTYNEDGSADDGAAGTAGNAPGNASSGGSSGVATTAPVRAPLVAYHRVGQLCVAAEDGSGERVVAASVSGVHALSPDGRTLAFVDAGSGVLSLADVASGAVVRVGPATQDTPSWSPDSTWLVYAAPGPMVMRVSGTGTGTTALFGGSTPSASVVGATLVGLAPSGEVVVWRDGVLAAVRVTGAVTGLATDGTTIYYGTMGGDGAVSLRAIGVDGAGERTLVASPGSTRAVTFGDLLLSPNGSQLVFSERSDDGYSRMFAVPAGGGAAVSLCVRRDCYPLRWTVDSSAVVFVEGNAIQGDPTALMSVAFDGASRRLLVQGADR